MSIIQLIQLGAVWGLVYGAVFCTAMLIIGRVNAEMILNDYPPDIRAKYGPMSSAVRKQASLASLPLLAALGLVTILALINLRRLTGQLAALDTLIVMGTMFQVWNLIDLLVLDWFLLMVIRPRFMILPGTEGLAGYHDWSFHLRKFFYGIGLTLALAMVVTLIALAVEVLI